MSVPSVALRLEAVRVCFGTHVAVESLSLHVRRGEVVALTGPNGSGKSTTLSVAAGLLTPQEGRVSIDDTILTSDSGTFAHHIGYVPQDHALYEELTASQNLEFFGQLYGLRGFALDAKIGRAFQRCRLGEFADQRVETFSGGMKQRLSIAIALLHEPSVLLLDEPTASLDQHSRDELYTELHRFRDEGHAVLLTTHHADEAEVCCDRVAILERGRLISDGLKPAQRRDSSKPMLVVFGQLRERMPKYVERRLRNRLGPEVDLEIIGRRVRLSASCSDILGRALATILADGVTLESFRTTNFRAVEYQG
jgi:ABC-2 type transport system ATP-binding protein